MTTTASILERITSGPVEVGIVGLGYVGLPLALTFVERANVRVTGFDIDRSKVERLMLGESYIGHLHSQRIHAAVTSGLLSATTNFAELERPDALLVTVPTPLTPKREPDMTYVQSTMVAIARRLRHDQLVVLESTTYPGTTEELVRPILEASGLRAGQDFFLGYSPEREDPGSAAFCTANIPKIVGGIDAISTKLTAALYRRAVTKVIEVCSARVAEATKLTENVFRSVNIALVNELKIAFDRMGIDIWSVLDAADTKPFGFMRFDPGPGLGGHCIPIDPFYLAHSARQVGAHTRFIELAGEVNLAMPEYVVEKLASALTARGEALRTSRILVLGLSYKRNIDDPRESPAFEIISLLIHAGANVSYHDPHLPVAPTMRSWPDLPPMQSVPLTAQSLASFSAAVLVTDHRDIDYQLVLDATPLVVDTRGVYRTSLPKVVKA